MCADDGVDFYLGADFIRAFVAMHDPDRNQLFVRIANATIDLEVACIDIPQDAQLSALGLRKESGGHGNIQRNFVIAAVELFF